MSLSRESNRVRFPCIVFVVPVVGVIVVVASQSKEGSTFAQNVAAATKRHAHLDFDAISIKTTTDGYSLVRYLILVI
jgi:hypothetical protein